MEFSLWVQNILKGFCKGLIRTGPLYGDVLQCILRLLNLCFFVEEFPQTVAGWSSAGKNHQGAQICSYYCLTIQSCRMHLATLYRDLVLHHQKVDVQIFIITFFHKSNCFNRKKNHVIKRTHVEWLTSQSSTSPPGSGPTNIHNHFFS